MAPTRLQARYRRQARQPRLGIHNTGHTYNARSTHKPHRCRFRRTDHVQRSTTSKGKRRCMTALNEATFEAAKETPPMVILHQTTTHTLCCCSVPQAHTNHHGRAASKPPSPHLNHVKPPAYHNIKWRSYLERTNEQGAQALRLRGMLRALCAAHHSSGGRADHPTTSVASRDGRCRSTCACSRAAHCRHHTPVVGHIDDASRHGVGLQLQRAGYGGQRAQVPAQSQHTAPCSNTVSVLSRQGANKLWH